MKMAILLCSLLVASCATTNSEAARTSSPASSMSGQTSVSSPESTTGSKEDSPPPSTVLVEQTTATTVTGSAIDFPRCETVPNIQPPDRFLRETPVYVANEAPIDRLRDFVTDMDGIQGVWFSDHNRWAAAAFHGVDIDAVQRAIEAEFGYAGVVTIELEKSNRQLSRISKRVDRRLPDRMDASNWNAATGFVEVWVEELNEGNLEEVAAAIEPGDPICVSGSESGSLPEPGPQRPSGDGWVFVGELDVSLQSDSGSRVVASQDTFDRLWERLGMRSRASDIDFENRVVFGFEYGYSGSCPESRFEGLIFGEGSITADIVSLSREQACTADYNPRTYLVAVDRSRLPEPPWTLFAGTDTRRGTRVHSDLRPTGAILGDGGTNPDFVQPEQRSREVPAFIETGFPWPATISINDDFSRIGPVNEVQWVATKEITEPPPEWIAAADDKGLLDVELLLTPGPEPTLTISGAGTSIEYRSDGTSAP